MERIVEMMQDEGTGVPVRTVKSFMSKVPSVFTGKITGYHSGGFEEGLRSLSPSPFCGKIIIQLNLYNVTCTGREIESRNRQCVVIQAKSPRVNSRKTCFM